MRSRYQGWMPLRQEFDVEWEDEAEALVSEIEFVPGELEAELFADFFPDALFSFFVVAPPAEAALLCVCRCCICSIVGDAILGKGIWVFNPAARGVPGLEPPSWDTACHHC